MKTALGFGLVLLTVTAPHAFAGGAPAINQEGALSLLLGGPASASAHSTPGYLGVSVRDVTPDQLGTLKLRDTRGAEIIVVDHDAPAGKAGLREHDVILQINGQGIANKDQLSRVLRESAPGRSITLVVSRDGQQLIVTTQMAVSQEQVEREASEQHLKVPEPPAPVSDSADTFTSSSPSAPRGNSFIGSLLMSPSYTGAMLEKMSTQLADYFGVSSGVGLLVRSVIDDSPAALAGMRAGDVVIRADSKPVASTGDWAKIIKNSHGHPLSITVMRDKKEQTLTLTPDGKRRSGVDFPVQPVEDVSRSLIA
jgi:serine protease Do